MRISDWSSDVCSSDLIGEFLALDDTEAGHAVRGHFVGFGQRQRKVAHAAEQIARGAFARDIGGEGRRIELMLGDQHPRGEAVRRVAGQDRDRSEEHTSELQSLMRISYAVFCLKKKTRIQIRK